MPRAPILYCIKCITHIHFPFTGTIFHNSMLATQGIKNGVVRIKVDKSQTGRKYEIHFKKSKSKANRHVLDKNQYCITLEKH